MDFDLLKATGETKPIRQFVSVGGSKVCVRQIAGIPFLAAIMMSRSRYDRLVFAPYAQPRHRESSTRMLG